MSPLSPGFLNQLHDFAGNGFVQTAKDQGCFFSHKISNLNHNHLSTLLVSLLLVSISESILKDFFLFISIHVFFKSSSDNFHSFSQFFSSAA